MTGDIGRPGLGYYDRGATPFIASRSDPRVSYCLYVPTSYRDDTDEVYDLIVIVHGTERGASDYRNLFSQFCEDNRCIVLAPLFACNLFGPGDLDNYKLLAGNGMRFDLLLLDIVEEVREKYRVSDKFFMQGFSGGGHFTHRFLYLYPELLAGASIGAPGVVTLLDDSLPWWVGTGGMDKMFGRTVDIAKIREVPIQMVVGTDDRETWEITVAEDTPWWIPGINDSGVTRIDRLTSLRQSFEQSGIAVRFDFVEDVAHDGVAVLDTVRAFFLDTLSALRGKVAA